ncbi:hypothetical protein PILCRDRAFT_11200 [Piloderma croceum F 1598]|uniref:Phytochrome n=1 Tax=Piloderma croceum (strain F 1598) TaxID=765440 RepID=A0A0C3AWW4_PILCF|nr:hypothetical protein PILCRDRAFT_11200 [Piloderma croceum F 1598]
MSTAVDDYTEKPTLVASSSQYVYPVRSLLSGLIHPAADELPSNPLQSSSLNRLDLLSNPPAPMADHPGGQDLVDDRSANRTQSSVNFSNDASSAVNKSDGSCRCLSSSTQQAKKDVGSSGHFLLRVDQNSPKTSTNNTSTALFPAPLDTFSQAFVAGPTGEPVPTVLTGETHDTDYIHLAQVSELAVDAFTTISTPQPPPLLPFNPSEYGIVHLAPRNSSTDRLSQSSSRRSRDGHYSTAPSSQKSSKRSELSSGISSLSPSPYSHPMSGAGSRDFSPSSHPPSLSQLVSGIEMTNEEPSMTTRYQHEEDENGNYLVIGMECEDEPIRTPGAVQGFGVLIAVDEDTDTGNLSVRQVSENSTELLGISPKYLFSLECFTETLPDSQADILWDNIQYLKEPDPEQEDNPHIFTLTGWGEKGSAIAGTPSDNGRRVWTCWCAIHRPRSVLGTESTPEITSGRTSSTIILEFELEQDIHNPLYPISDDASSDSSSPTSNSSETTRQSSSATASDFTLVTKDDLIPPTALDAALENIGGVAEQEKHRPPIVSDFPTVPSSLAGLEGENDWVPSAEDILESTTCRSKPIPALERLRRIGRSTPAALSSGSVRARRASARTNTSRGGVGIMDVFAVMTQINEQLGAAPGMDSFLKIVAGVIKDLSQFHRVLVYQFDEVWNGQVVAELVDWRHSHDLFKGLHFPASDIPPQARELYAISPVRLLYDCSQPTARMVVRSKADLKTPLNMTHCYLRAMSPFHINYLANMGVRASMFVSIMAFGGLWGLIACHSYGTHKMRVSVPVRQMLRLLSQSISRNIERLIYAQRLHTRKTINAMGSGNQATGHIVSDSDDLLGLFDADYGILVIGEGAKTLGPNLYGQEVLVMAEYLRLKQFETIKVSQAVVEDFPDLELSTGLEVIAGLLYVPLSSGGKDFIAFFRKGQPRHIHWAGRPQKQGVGDPASLEPRKSFKIWSEVVAGRCRAWTDEQMETVGVLSLVYGKFIEVWRQKETALQTTKFTNILLSNASHEVRTPIHQIVNYLEMALEGHLDLETRENLSISHAASKSLLFTINDLLDLTRLESGHETSLNVAFDLQTAIEEAVLVYRNEAGRRNLEFKLDISESPKMVVGDPKKIKTAVANLTANSLKFTTEGSITIQSRIYGEPDGLRAPTQTAVEIVVADTGRGISSDMLDSIFREFEQVESSEPKNNAAAGLGLGLAVVARIVEQLGGQLRVHSEIGKGSKFSFLIPLTLSGEMSSDPGALSDLLAATAQSNIRMDTPRNGGAIEATRIDSLQGAQSSNHMGESPGNTNNLGGIKEDSLAMGGSLERQSTWSSIGFLESMPESSNVPPPSICGASHCSNSAALRVLIVEDNDVNRRVLAKRLSLCGHAVVNTTNGQEGLDKVKEDQDFDCILMDLQMPIMDGYEATEGIRKLEGATASMSMRPSPSHRLSHKLNGRIPIFAVSASLIEQQHAELCELGVDGWILKPIDFKRLDVILKGVTDTSQRELDEYRPGCSWEIGGWFTNVTGPLTAA